MSFTIDAMIFRIFRHEVFFMSAFPPLAGLPMTTLEMMLKEYLMQRPDISDHILTSEELTDYIRWLALIHNRPTNLSISDIPVRPQGSRISEIADRMLENPLDDQMLSLISSGITKQSEERYIMVDHDISVGRMLRYMPSHWHTNAYFEIYYAFSGNCPIFFQDEVIELKQGTVLIVAPSAVHASPCFSDDCVLIYYMVRSSTFDQVFWNQIPTDSLMATFFRQALNSQHPSSYLHFETGADADIHQLLLEIYHEYYKDEPYQTQLLNALMSTFFIRLLRGYEGTARLPRTEDFFWKHEFSAILSYIQTNYATVNQSDLAERFHYSERQIGRIVQNCMGMTYNQLILKLRMEKAASLLRQGVSIEAVSNAVGYSTLSSFYRAFAKYFHCTPVEYHSKSTYFPRNDGNSTH